MKDDKHPFDRFSVELFNPEMGMQWVEFDFFRNAIILVPVLVNGVPGTALLDSGADIVMVSEEFSKRIGGVGKETVLVAATGGTATSPIISGLEVVFGGLRVRSITAAVVDLATPSMAMGRRLDLMIGREFFETLIVAIDFDLRKIGFQTREAFVPPSEAIRVPLRRFNRSRVIDVTLEGGPPVQMQFDLGLDMAIMLSKPFWSKRAYLLGRRWSTTLFASAAGPCEAQIASFREIGIAGATVQDVSVIFAPARGEGDNFVPPGVIGMPILSRFNIVTDYQRDCLYLTSRVEDKRGGVSKDRAGLRLVHERNRLRILLVARNSPAAQRGWSIGDMIVEVNGQRVGPDYWQSQLWRWTTFSAGTLMRFKMADGSERDLELADYY